MRYQFLLLDLSTAKTKMNKVYFSAVYETCQNVINSNPLLENTKHKTSVYLKVIRLLSHIESAMYKNNNEAVQIPLRQYVKDISKGMDKRNTVNQCIKELINNNLLIKINNDKGNASYKVGEACTRYALPTREYKDNEDSHIKDMDGLEHKTAPKYEYPVCGGLKFKTIRNNKKIEMMRKQRTNTVNNMKLVLDNSIIDISKLFEIIRAYNIEIDSISRTEYYVNYHKQKGMVYKVYREWKELVKSQKKTIINVKKCSKGLSKEEKNTLKMINDMNRKTNAFLDKLAKLPFLFRTKTIGVRGKKTKREFTLMTSLPKTLRNIIIPKDNKKIKVEIDLKNAQPFALLSDLDKNNRAGVEEEVIDAIYNKHFITLFDECEYFINKGWSFKNNKDDMKPYVYSQVLFASQNYKHIDIINCGKKDKRNMPVWKYVAGYYDKENKVWVEGRYPGFARLIQWTDKDNYGQTIASFLQNKEAQVIMPLLKKYIEQGYTAYSVHDSIVIYLDKTEDIELISEEIKSMARKVFNIPTYVERIIDIKIGE